MYNWEWIKNGDITKALQIRFEVFCDEQGYSHEQEVDELDKSSLHLVCLNDDIPIAAGRIVKDTEYKAHIGRICVKKNMRGTGLGRELVEKLIDKCKELHFKEIVVGAQVRAMGFYEKLGFIPYGEQYMDGHVPHIPMVMTINN